MMTPEQLTGQTDTHLNNIYIGQKSFLVHRKINHDLLALKNAADNAGFNLHIASGFRSFDQQLNIWNKKMSGVTALLDEHCHSLDVNQLTDLEKVFSILRWSALPGASRHHWGTDFDIFDRNALTEHTVLKLEPWEYETGHQAEFSHWLINHLSHFGFFLPYDKDYGGVACEPWHISHASASQCCMQQFNQAIIAQQLDSQSILGKSIIQSHLNQIYNQFVININPLNYHEEKIALS